MFVYVCLFVNHCLLFKSVNPSDERSVVEALVQALTMPPEEQEQRLVKMQARLRTYTVQWWAATFIADLDKLAKEQAAVGSKRLTGDRRKQLFEAYRSAKNRLVRPFPFRFCTNIVLCRNKYLTSNRLATKPDNCRLCSITMAR